VLTSAGRLRSAAGIEIAYAGGVGSGSRLSFVGADGELDLTTDQGFRFANATNSTGAIDVRTCYQAVDVLDSPLISAALSVVRPAICNRCVVASPCQHGSTCIDLPSDYRCTCPVGYTGKDWYVFYAVCVCVYACMRERL
jgi:hypothetical protein